MVHGLSAAASGNQPLVDQVHPAAAHMPLLTNCYFDSKVWVFADAPHLVKLIRTHAVDEKGGLMVPRAGEEGPPTALLSRRCFQDLLQLTNKELSPCHNLTSFHVEVSKFGSTFMYILINVTPFIERLLCQFHFVYTFLSFPPPQQMNLNTQVMHMR